MKKNKEQIEKSRRPKEIIEGMVGMLYYRRNQCSYLTGGWNVIILKKGIAIILTGEFKVLSTM